MHRSQYDFIDGFAKHMRDALPKASFIGLTGRPIENSDKNTQAVFGDHIDVYDMTASQHFPSVTGSNGKKFVLVRFITSQPKKSKF